MPAEPPQTPTDPGAVQVDIRDLLNAQTGRLGWPELERPFARGQVLVVAADLDLIEVAARLVADDATAIQGWLAAGRLARATLDQARDWQARRPGLWAVVTAPWVLVQEDRPAPHPGA